MSRKTKLTESVIEQVYQYKRKCLSNIEVCKLLGITESTFYDWLTAGSPRFNSEFSESYKKGVEDSKHHLKDLSVGALVQSLKGFTSEQVHYRADGTIEKKVTKTTPPNATLALNILQTLDSANFPKEPEKEPNKTLPPAIVNISKQDLEDFKKKFDEEY